MASTKRLLKRKTCGSLKRKDWNKVKVDISESWNSHWPVSRGIAFSRLTRKGASPRCASKLVRGIFAKLKKQRPHQNYGPE